jgi:SAM-dependent methyltransferase
MPNISFDEFKALATRDGLTWQQRVDDPTDVRAGKIGHIVADIYRTIPRLGSGPACVVDIGPGCGPMPLALIEAHRRHGHHMVMLDSAEMLAHLPDGPSMTKIAGRFPDIFGELKNLVANSDVVIAYGMLHYVFEHDNVWAFLDRALALLAPGGYLMIGDVPCWSRRKRKWAAEGKTLPALDIRDGEIWPGGLSDAVIFGLMSRATESGFDAFLLPQPAELPMSGWRVDLLFQRPTL